MGEGFFANAAPETALSAQPAKPTEATKTNFIADEEIERWLFAKTPFESNICCLMLGQDGTGKTGLVMDYLSDEDVKNGYKILILDLDGGGLPLLHKYHKNKMANIIVKNPLEFGVDDNGETVTDYKQTLNKIKSTIRWCARNYEKQKIKAIVFDGLSTLLSHAEYIMRIERNIATDGGVSQRYWIVRLRIFTEIMEQVKSIPIARFFIAHEDFIASPDKELSSAKRKTGQMMFQKIRCLRIDTPDKVVFRAICDKSKDASEREGLTMDFCIVDKEKKTVLWEGRKLLAIMLG